MRVHDERKCFFLLFSLSFQRLRSNNVRKPTRYDTSRICHPLLKQTRQTGGDFWVLREVKCLGLTLYRGASRPPSGTGRLQDPPLGWLRRARGSEGGALHSTVNALIVCSVQMIMCNVAALTFYATIYEDICHVCNKSRKKKACTWYCKALRVVCVSLIFDCWEFFCFVFFVFHQDATVYNRLQSSGFIRSNLTCFFLYCMPL